MSQYPGPDYQYEMPTDPREMQRRIEDAIARLKPADLKHRAWAAFQRGDLIAAARWAEEWARVSPFGGAPRE